MIRYPAVTAFRHTAQQLFGRKHPSLRTLNSRHVNPPPTTTPETYVSTHNKQMMRLAKTYPTKKWHNAHKERKPLLTGHRIVHINTLGTTNKVLVFPQKKQKTPKRKPKLIELAEPCIPCPQGTPKPTKNKYHYRENRQGRSAGEHPHRPRYAPADT